MSSDSVTYDLLPLTLDELWALHDYVRQHDKQGQEWDQDFIERVMAAILEAQEHPVHQAALMTTEDELWQMDRQIPSALMTGTQPVGRNLLIKIMRLICKMRGGEEDVEHSGSGQDARQEPSGGSSAATAPR